MITSCTFKLTSLKTQGFPMHLKILFLVLLLIAPSVSSRASTNLQEQLVQSLASLTFYLDELDKELNENIKEKDSIRFDEKHLNILCVSPMFQYTYVSVYIFVSVCVLCCVYVQLHLPPRP